jgi:hypothetical protein
VRNARSIGQLVVWQRWIGRFQAGITFGLQSTHHIDNRDQADLAHPFDPHDALPRPSAILDGECEVLHEMVGASRDAEDLDVSDQLV